MTDGADIFYTLPAQNLVEGVSTADGQDVISVDVGDDGMVFAQVYTPRSDDPEQDASNRGAPESRLYRVDDRVDLAVFSDTEVDLSEHDAALIGDHVPRR
jgi:hypothetical protein